MTSQPIEPKYYALAAVCQAAILVQQLARKHPLDQQAFEASIGSIVVTDADSTEAIYHGAANLRLGLQTLIHQLSDNPRHKDAEITRYIAGLLQLERKLSGNRQQLNQLGERIAQIQRQQSLFSLLDGQMLSNLASVYSDVISPLGAKIQVAGEPAELQQPLIQHKVRAMLLAGIRAAVLWRQLGGKRRQILFSRRKMLNTAQQALSQIDQSNPV